MVKKIPLIRSSNHSASVTFALHQAPFLGPGDMVAVNKTDTHRSGPSVFGVSSVFACLIEV